MFHSSSDLVQNLKDIANALFDENREDLANRLLELSRNISANTIVGNIPPSNILAGAINLFSDSKIDFALIGGMAVSVHGQSRSTQDLNFLVSHFPLEAKLRDSNYMSKFSFYRGKSSTGSVLAIDHRGGGGYIELLLANDSLRKFSLKTVKVENVLKMQIPVVNPACLVALKLKASSENNIRKNKDFPDILSVILKSNPDFSKVKKFLSAKELITLKNLMED